MKEALLSFFLLFTCFCLKAHAAKPYLVADISTHDVILNYDFKGQYITISGIVTDINDIIVVVEGPVRAYRIWKKERVDGIWANRESLTIPAEHSYFYIASTNALDKIASTYLLNELDIHYQFNDSTIHEKYPKLQFAQFQEEFKLYRQKLQLFPRTVGDIERIGENIFRAKFFLPTCAYHGKYEVKVYGFSESKIMKIIKLYFEVRKQGLYATIDEVSRVHPMQYTFVAIMISLFIGLTAAFLFRKDR